MKLLYFAWLRTRIGKGEEILTPPIEVRTVRALLDWLKDQSPGHAEALKNLDVIRVAVNHEHVQLDAPVGPNDEVALFPPVTGG
jgi:molybdopterin synthase sulfur carrier subunit